MYEDLRGKRLLILGGIRSMIEVVQRAHDFGMEVYVTDYLPDSPAKKYADKSFLISTTDLDLLEELCKKEEIDGVFTGNNDFLLPYYALLCNRLGLPCYGSYQHFCLMTDKRRFKEVCRQYGVKVVPEYSAHEIDAGNVTYPVIVKPVDSSGSRGISVCYNRDELIKGIDRALVYSKSRQYIVERYMTGEEAVLYYYLQDGNPVFAGMCDRYVDKSQPGVAQLPTAYIFPSGYTRSHIEKTDKAIKDMFRGIAMKNGPVFLQAFIEEGTPIIYEPGYRLNGAREQYIFGPVNGINSIDMLLNYSITGKIDENDIEALCDPFIHGKYACKLSPLIREGTVGEIIGVEDVEKMPSVKKVVLNNVVGDTIGASEVGTLRQVAYRAFIVDDTIDELKRDIDIIQSTIDYRDQQGNSLMMAQFDTKTLINNYL